MVARLTLSRLAPGSGLVGFGRFVPPLYRPLLLVPSTRALVAVTARRGLEPVGLALAERVTSGLRLVSLTVAPRHRRQGIGRALLTELELGERGTLSHGAAAHAWTDAARALTRVAGYPAPREQGTCYTFEAARLVPRLPPAARRPRGLTLTRWTGLSGQERAALAAASWLPGALSPFAHEAGVVPELSFALRTSGGVAGWILAQRASAEVVHYPCLFVRPALSGVGAGGALLAAALHAHAADPLLARCQGQLLVRADSKAMERMLRRRFSGLERGSTPYLEVNKSLTH